jgi:U3 small nucleolar RNA-associated protein 20
LEPSAILQWFAAMVSYLDADSLERYLVHVLTPVYRLLEDDTVRDTGMGKFSKRQLAFAQLSSDDLKATAQELQDLVQSKVGTTKFLAIYGQIRQGTLAIKKERKAARATLVSI